MSNKRHNHGIIGFKSNIPKAELSHIIGNGVYHPTKGFRKLRAFNQHIVLNQLLAKIGLHPVIS